MKHLRRWLTIAVIVAVAAVAMVFGKTLLGGSGATAQTTQVVSVTRGNLTASISPTGQVEAVKSTQLSFDVTRVALLELPVSAGQQVQQGELLAALDTASLQLAVDQAQANLLSAQETLDTANTPYTELDQRKAELDVTQAETALQQAQDALDTLLASDLDAAQSAVAQAEYSLQSAQLNLALTQHGGPVGKTVRDLEYAVAWHERQLRNLQAQHDQGTVEQSAVDTEDQTLSDLQVQLATAKANAATTLLDAQVRVAQAEETLATAQTKLADLQAGPDALAVAQARDKVSQAEYNLAKAKDTAATVAAGPSVKDVQLAQTRYDAAAATLSDAQATLDNATMLAPFDGTVMSIGAEEGDLVSSNNIIVTLADLSALRVVATIDETEIAQVKVGQAASITFDSLSGQTFKGVVLEVPLESSISQNVVTYQVPVSLEGAETAALLPGMTANISIVIGQRQSVLLLPVLAVQLGETGNVVTLQDTGSTTPVELGLNDGLYVEVLRGLNEGDQVIEQIQDVTSSQQTGFGGRGGGSFAIGVGSIGR